VPFLARSDLPKLAIRGVSAVHDAKLKGGALGAMSNAVDCCQSGLIWTTMKRTIVCDFSQPVAGD
jgi:hypothetical protein